MRTQKHYFYAIGAQEFKAQLFERAKEIGYWMDFPELHNYMVKQWKIRAQVTENLKGQRLPIDADDLAALAAMFVKNKDLKGCPSEAIYGHWCNMQENLGMIGKLAFYIHERNKVVYYQCVTTE
jgi:hypothetical protein